MVDQVTILGATGSIGESTLDVIQKHTDRFKVFGLWNVSYNFQACRGQGRPRSFLLTIETRPRMFRVSGLVFGVSGLVF